MLVGFVAGLMYLGQVATPETQAAARRPTCGCPASNGCKRANSRAIVVSLLMLGLGVLSGMVLNRINSATRPHASRWNDPVVLSTWLMFFWLLAAVVAIAIYRPARQGRKVAYLTVASFVFLVIMLAAGLLMDSRHWGRGRRKGGGRKAEGGTDVSH